MQLLMTGMDASHHLVPGAFNRRTVRSQLMTESRLRDQALAGGNKGGQGNPHTNRHNTCLLYTSDAADE